MTKWNIWWINAENMVNFANMEPCVIYTTGIITRYETLIAMMEKAIAI